jgi:hypothetical protein
MLMWPLISLVHHDVPSCIVYHSSFDSLSLDAMKFLDMHFITIAGDLHYCAVLPVIFQLDWLTIWIQECSCGHVWYRQNLLYSTR